MTLEDREYIQEALGRGLYFKEIARYLKKDPTTISKEIRKHRVHKKPAGFNNSSKNICRYMLTCKIHNICNIGNCKVPCRQCHNCNDICPSFEKNVCKSTTRAPYICNGCKGKSQCHLDKYYYTASIAQREYEEMLIATREGINMTVSEFKQLDTLISPLIKRGQSIAHICASHPKEISCTERTIYNYFENDFFSAINIDLPRKVRYKKRHVNKRIESCDYAVRENRTYTDFLSYIQQNPEISIVEMDTVEGVKGGKVILTLLIRSCRLQIAFLMPHKTQKCVEDCFNSIYEILGHKLFSNVFGAILTDNGSEFLNPLSLENASEKVKRTSIFYCDPYSAYQKGMLEKNHEFIRYVLPKGTSFDDLIKADILLLTNHINSLTRDSLNSKSPFVVADFLLPNGFLNLLGYIKIPPALVLLRPSLLD